MHNGSAPDTAPAAVIDAVQQPTAFDVEHEVSHVAIARAQRTVASNALDADDCRELLSMLGISEDSRVLDDFSWRPSTAS